VAGYDLSKLFTGSLGTLGLIATANFRLHPRPEAAWTVVTSTLWLVMTTAPSGRAASAA